MKKLTANNSSPLFWVIPLSFSNKSTKPNYLPLIWEFHWMQIKLKEKVIQNIIWFFNMFFILSIAAVTLKEQFSVLNESMSQLQKLSYGKWISEELGRRSVFFESRNEFNEGSLSCQTLRVEFSCVNFNK